MEAEEATAMSGKIKPPSLPPALYLIRARPRTSKVLGLDSPSRPPTSPLRSHHLAVPFLWEEAPGKPKLYVPAAAASPLCPGVGAAASDGGDHDDGARGARLVPLKLPPRLQSAGAATPAEYSLSPKTVLHGPYCGGGGKKPPRPLRRSGSTASCRRKPGAGGGGGLFSWRKAATAAVRGKKDGSDHDAAAAPDASCCSPASSSSSSSVSCFVDDQSRGAHRRQADGHEGSEDREVGEEDSVRSVRITRLRRNRSLPSVTTSHLWASIRKSVKLITPWS